MTDPNLEGERVNLNALDQAVADALAKLNEPVRKRLGTWAGYGSSLAGFITFALAQSDALHLAPGIQIALLIAASALGGVTTIGRQVQATGKDKGRATVVAAVLGPATPGIGVPLTSLPAEAGRVESPEQTAGWPTGPTPDGAPFDTSDLDHDDLSDEELGHTTPAADPEGES